MAKNMRPEIHFLASAKQPGRYVGLWRMNGSDNWTAHRERGRIVEHCTPAEAQAAAALDLLAHIRNCQGYALTATIDGECRVIA